MCNLLFLFGKALLLTIFYTLKEAFFRWFFLESSEIIVLLSYYYRIIGIGKAIALIASVIL